MSRINGLEHRFVDGLPEKLEPGVLYIALEFATMSHLCCCGCGQEVVTPLSPKDWKMTFDGESVSVHPSIGNWSLICRSHYIIRGGRVQWANDWSDAQIRQGRERDLTLKRGGTRSAHTPEKTPEKKQIVVRISLWRRIVRWLFRG